jgi:hypothetical protein
LFARKSEIYSFLTVNTAQFTANGDGAVLLYWLFISASKLKEGVLAPPLSHALAWRRNDVSQYPDTVRNVRKNLTGT